MKVRLSIICILFVVLLSSCSKSSVAPQTDTPEMAIARTALDNTNQALMSGNWVITACTNNNTDVTGTFENCGFGFVSNGSLTVLKNGVGSVGKWVTSYVDNQVRFSLTFANQSGMNAISGDWTIVSSTSQKMNMQAVTSSNNLLTLEKR